MSFTITIMINNSMLLLFSLFITTQTIVGSFFTLSLQSLTCLLRFLRGHMSYFCLNMLWECVCKLFKTRGFTIKSFKCNFTTVFDFIDCYSDSNSWYHHFILTICSFILLEWQTFQEHPLNWERFFINSSSKILVHFNHLKPLIFTDYSEYFKYFIAW